MQLPDRPTTAQQAQLRAYLLQAAPAPPPAAVWHISPPAVSTSEPFSHLVPDFHPELPTSSFPPPVVYLQFGTFHQLTVSLSPHAEDWRPYYSNLAAHPSTWSSLPSSLVYYPQPPSLTYNSLRRSPPLQCPRCPHHWPLPSNIKSATWIVGSPNKHRSMTTTCPSRPHTPTSSRWQPPWWFRMLSHRVGSDSDNNSAQATSHNV